MSECLHAQVGNVALLIEATAEGIYLYTHRPDSFIADSWHPTIEEAKAQAAYAMNKVVGPWRSVSPELKLELNARFAIRK